VNDQFPGSGKTGLIGLRLPKFQIERPVHFFNFSSALDKSSSHKWKYMLIAQLH